MRERIELVGGRLTVESARDTGTTIAAEVPLARPRTEHGG
jgi:signal transduction histidine kinase